MTDKQLSEEELERADFDAYCESKGYGSFTTRELLWPCWQARAALSQQPECGEVEVVEILRSLIENIEAKGNYSEESTINFLNQALADARQQQRLLAERDARIDSIMETFVRVADHLGIDTEQARKAPGKPSDVFITHIDQVRARVAELSRALEAIADCTDDDQARNVAVAALTQPSGGEDQ